MIVYLASIDDNVIPALYRQQKKETEIRLLFLYYDLSDICPIPFRKASWQIIIKDKSKGRRDNENKKG